MRGRRWIFGLLLCFALAVSAAAQTAEKTLSLTLDECVFKAMKNSLGVAIQVLNPESKRKAVALAGERFMPVFNLGYSHSDENQPAFSWYDSSDKVRQVFGDTFAELKLFVPTGADIAVRFNTSKYDTNERALLINPSYRSSVRFELSQPLLRNFGPLAARREVIIARNELAMSEKDLQGSLQEIVYGVEEAYWQLVFAIEDLKVRQGSLKLAQDLLERNKKAVKAGAMASVEVLTAEAQIAARQADIVQAEAAVRNNEDVLKLLVNLAAEVPDLDRTRIVPQDTPRAEGKAPALDSALAIARENRPDLQSLRIGVTNSQATLDYARNQTLPDLSLAAAYWSPGLSGTALVYPPGNPFGTPIKLIVGGRSGSLQDAFGMKNGSWSVGLTLSIPVGTVLSRALQAQAKVDLDRTNLELKFLLQQAETKVRIALRDVETAAKRIEALGVARALAEKQLAAEETKLRSGYSTNYFVLLYQGEVAKQRSEEIRAGIDLTLAVSRLNREMGISLRERNIKIGGNPVD